MANETLLANVLVLVPEVIERQIQPTAARQKVFEPVLTNPFTFRDVTGPGDIFDIPQADTLTFAALDIDGTDNTFEQWVPTQRQFAPVKIGTTLRLIWEARSYAQQDPVPMIVSEVANAWATLDDSSSTLGFASLYGEASSSPDNEHGTDGVAMDHTLIRQSYLSLISAGAIGPYNHFIDPIQLGELYTDAIAVSLMKESGSQPAGFSTTEGLRMDMFAGKMFGMNIWCVPTGLYESSGLHSMGMGQRAVGLFYKQMSTPLSPTQSRLNLDIQWQANPRSWDIAITVVQHISGAAFTSTTNKWMTDCIS